MGLSEFWTQDLLIINLVSYPLDHRGMIENLLIFHVFIFVVYKWLKKLRKNVYFSNTFWLYQLRVSSAQFLSNISLNSEILILDTL